MPHIPGEVQLEGLQQADVLYTFSYQRYGAPTMDIAADAIRVDLSRGGVSFADVERALLTEALRAANGHRRRAAELLDLSSETLRYRLEKHGLTGAVEKTA